MHDGGHDGTVRILVAPDGFTGTLTAVQAAEAVAAGWSRGAPHDALELLPLADGGPGFLEVLHAALGGELVPRTVTGPLGEPVPAVMLVRDTAQGRVVHLESAHAVGLHLVPQDRRDPGRTTTTGLGELLRAALELEPRRVVVGLGGSGTNDGGAGLLAGLGLPAPVLRGGGAGLDAVTAEDLAGLPDLVRSFAGVDLVAATDVDVPLLGLHGASAGFAPQKGASPELAQHLERALGHYAHLVAEVAVPAHRRDLLGGDDPRALRERARDLVQVPGGGAAGGLGFGLAVLGARVLPGAGVVADAVRLSEHVAAADVVVTGEGTLDWQSLHGKVVDAVAQVALRHGVPVVVVAGQVQVGRREWSAAGIAGAYAVVEHPADLAACLADPAGTLAARVERVARTWSR